MHPLVSICVPTRNGEQYLAQTLDSIKEQTYPNIEVVISDDNSTDATIEICKQFQSAVSFPVYIHQHIPDGIGENWNNAIHFSKGEYIKLLFQDDIMDSKCIEIMMTTLRENQLEIVISKRNIIDENANKITSGDWFELYGDLQKTVGIPDAPLFIFSKEDFKLITIHSATLFNIFGEPCCSLFSNKLYHKIGPFNKSLRQVLDYEYWLRILKHYKIGIIKEKLISFRHHSDQYSNENAKKQINEKKIIEKFIHKDFFKYFNKKERRFYLMQKYPLLKFVLGLKYKLFK